MMSKHLISNLVFNYLFIYLSIYLSIYLQSTYYLLCIYFLDLPNEILSTPLGQMLAPMIQQMTPSGRGVYS